VNPAVFGYGQYVDKRAWDVLFATLAMLLQIQIFAHIPLPPYFRRPGYVLNRVIWIGDYLDWNEKKQVTKTPWYYVFEKSYPQIWLLNVYILLKKNMLAQISSLDNWLHLNVENRNNWSFIDFNLGSALCLFSWHPVFIIRTTGLCRRQWRISSKKCPVWNLAEKP
jgi:hypothetical protein